MAMLADLVELVIGVDTHKHAHTAAVVRFGVAGPGWTPMRRTTFPGAASTAPSRDNDPPAKQASSG
jgi:hypothetical protein